jgi:murein L,D-transpeptidase YcbB/YkuD
MQPAKNHYRLYHYLAFVVVGCFLLACNHSPAKEKKELVTDPAQMDKQSAHNIRVLLDLASQHNGMVDDSIRLNMVEVVDHFYSSTDFGPVWSKKEKWQPLADSLYDLIAHAELQGLFPNDYNFKNLHSLKNKLDGDSILRTDATLWARADLLLTDGFMRIVKDLKLGRLQPDSISLNKDTGLLANFYTGQLKDLLTSQHFTPLLNALQPKHKGYWELKNGIKRFVDSMDRKTYTYVTYPYKKGDAKDSVFFVKTLQKRLNESNCIDFINKLPDTTQLGTAISKYQRQKGLKADGKVSTSLVKLMNTSDAEKFKRIAITLDRYKQMPVQMPEKYIWVNLPGFYLWVIDHDTVALESKIICGKPDTRTPLLNSEITDMVTYPTWTVPTSIIAKSYLPKLKNNPNYLNRIGLKLVNGKGETIDPGNVNWSKYSKGIPFKVMQNSGDNNALGVMKFNFNNPFAVYLHDTNQRYLFKNANRSLSHGCVRVQEWEKLAFFIARNDSINSHSRDSLRYNTDSIRNWIAHKERRRIDVKNKIPLFIRYFTCEGKNGKIIFYDDIYSEDKILREKYFANK